MPLKWLSSFLLPSFSLLSFLLLGSLLSSKMTYANNANNLDSQSIEWLISQVNIGEIQQNQVLIDNSLDKLLSIAPNNLQVQCTQARIYFATNKINNATDILNKLTASNQATAPCVKKLALLSRLTTQDKAQIQQARLLARASQYDAAIKIYNSLFSNLYPNIAYEFEHINWISAEGNNWQQALRGYQSLIARFANIGHFDIAYAKHLLKRNIRDKKALDIFTHYAHSNQYTVDAEVAWLDALNRMPIDKTTELAYTNFLYAYPHSSKGNLQHTDFKKNLKTELIKQADPAYQMWKKAVTALDKQQYAKAAKLLQQAIKGRPNDHDILYSLGILNLRQGKNSRAYYYFKEALKNTQDIDLTAVYNGLANTAQFWQYINEAKQALTANSLNTARLKLNLADTLNESPNTVNYYRGQLFQAKGDLQQAMTYYKAILNNDALNTQALSAMLSIISTENDYQRTNQFYYSLTRQQQIAIAQDYKIIQSQQLRKEADTLTEQNQLDKAISLLLTAIKKTPRQSWLYYDVAKLYQQQGLLNSAKALYTQILSQFPLDAELRYSHALFLRSLNNYQAALDTLSYIPKNARNTNINQLIQQLKVNKKIDDIVNNLENKSKASIIESLTQLSEQPLTPLMQAEVASQWQKINEYHFALNQLHSALQRDATLNPYWHMTYGQWLLASNNNQLTKQWFDRYQLPTSATNDQQNRWISLQVNYINKFNQDEQRIVQLAMLNEQYANNSVIANALIIANIELDRPKEATDIYQKQLHQGNSIEPETALAIVRVSRELGKHLFADNIITNLINNVDREQVYQQQLLMASLIDFNDKESVIDLTNELLKKSNVNQELYYQAAQVAEKHGKKNHAKQWYREAIEPNSSTKITENPALNYDLYTLQDDVPWYVNNAKRELSRMQQQDQAYITAGVNFSSQTSTQNDASLGAGSIPIELGISLWEGLAIVKLDPMKVSSQETRFDETFSGSNYGQGALCILDCPLTNIKPEQAGVDIGFAWLNDTWRFDIGTTPLGFLVEDIVWGVDYNGDVGNLGYGITLNKRPVTSSVLSYAGLKEVITNEIWGGVRSTSLKFSLSHDLGLEWGFWGSADFQLLKGKNVKDNQRYSIMGGAYNRYIQNKKTELTLGVNLLHWSYQYNLSEETFGHGGYYSPQSYIGVSIPVIYDHRVNNDFIYQLRAGLSWSTTSTDSSNYFPNNPALQAQAEVREAITGVSPFFEESETSGISYSLAGSFEYRYTPHWSFGGFFKLDRADFYEPNYAQLYFRYHFKPVYSELKFPGTPVVPYANY